jgi:hypothetical protein
MVMMCSTIDSTPSASRIDAIKDGSLALAQYSYLGSGTFVVNDYTEPDIKWTLADLSGTNDPEDKKRGQVHLTASSDRELRSQEPDFGRLSWIR